METILILWAISLIALLFVTYRLSRRKHSPHHSRLIQIRDNLNHTFTHNGPSRCRKPGC